MLVARKRAGPVVDGKCYTLRGIDMNAMDLIAPLQLIACARTVRLPPNSFPSATVAMSWEWANGFGPGLHFTNPKICHGKLIGCAVAADSLIAASVSNWGGYALAAAANVWYTKEYGGGNIEKWIDRCIPTEEQDTTLLRRRRASSTLGDPQRKCFRCIDPSLPSLGNPWRQHTE